MSKWYETTKNELSLSSDRKELHIVLDDEIHDLLLDCDFGNIYTSLDIEMLIDYLVENKFIDK